jgi:predicted transcriptional regulator
MDKLKEATIESIKKMPDGISVEDIMYRINVVAQVLEGLKDADTGRTITTNELLKKVDEWGK